MNKNGIKINLGTLVSYVPYSKKHWQWKHFGEFGKLQHFVKFFANFHKKFHNIPYANGLYFIKVFSAKLPTVLIPKLFYCQSFFTVRYTKTYVTSFNIIEVEYFYNIHTSARCINADIDGSSHIYRITTGIIYATLHYN